MELEYTIIRSPKRKKLTITVERDRSVAVHAPVNTPEDKIREVVESKRQWIYEKTKHDQKYRAIPHPPGKEMVNGESALYLGRNYKIEISPDGAAEVSFDHGFFVPAVSQERQKDALKKWYINKAKAKIIPRARSYSDVLGVEYAAAKIVDNRYRWGSCTTKNNVNFNWRLIKAPMYVIDYVIVHELAHLLEPNHTPRFWNIVRAQSPNMTKAKAWLRENGQILEEEI